MDLPMPTASLLWALFRWCVDVRNEPSSWNGRPSQSDALRKDGLACSDGLNMFELHENWFNLFHFWNLALKTPINRSKNSAVSPQATFPGALSSFGIWRRIRLFRVPNNCSSWVDVSYLFTSKIILLKQHWSLLLCEEIDQPWQHFLV